MINICIQNGVPDIAAKHAVYNTGQASAEAAVEWFYMNIENPVIQVPLMVPNPKKGAGAAQDSGKPAIDPEKIEQLKMFGFTEQQAKRALRKCDNNIERAGDWIMSHMDEPDSDEGSMEVDQSSQAVAEEVKSVFLDAEPNKGMYRLHSTVTHLGSSLHAGHYVCHVRKDGKWIYYNDSKVAETDDPPIGKGYMYFFRKAEN